MKTLGKMKRYMFTQVIFLFVSKNVCQLMVFYPEVSVRVVFTAFSLGWLSLICLTEEYGAFSLSLGRHVKGKMLKIKTSNCLVSVSIVTQSDTNFNSLRSSLATYKVILLSSYVILPHQCAVVMC